MLPFIIYNNSNKWSKKHGLELGRSIENNKWSHKHELEEEEEEEVSKRILSLLKFYNTFEYSIYPHFSHACYRRESWL